MVGNLIFWLVSTSGLWFKWLRGWPAVARRYKRLVELWPLTFASAGLLSTRMYQNCAVRGPSLWAWGFISSRALTPTSNESNRTTRRFTNSNSSDLSVKLFAPRQIPDIPQ